MLNGLFYAHSGLRYLVLLAGLLTLFYSAYLVVGGRTYTPLMRRFAAAFAGLLHLQILIGFFVLVSGRFSPAFIGHIFMMLFAGVIAQVPLSVLRRRPPEARTPTPHLVATAAALLLIWGGVAAIGRGLLTSSF